MKNKTTIILIAIFCVGIFLRTYNFSNNIFFEIDQARDYRIIDKILTNGISEFPLVGPKAGGTFFRLGSLFYLPALISGKIFGLSVFSMVLPELIFSILTIPVFYLFLKEFFSQRISLYLTALFSVSLFSVEYTYFSWNPNSIPFFLILSFYSLLRYSRSKNDNFIKISLKNFLLLQKIKIISKSLDNKTFWISLFAFSTAWAMQLHTIALIGMPIILSLYFIITKIRFSFKHFVIFVVISVFLFLPLIGNDILTKGENIQEFLKATIKRNISDEGATMPKKSFMDVYNFNRFYTNILMSKNFISDPIRVESSDGLNDLMSKNFSNSVLKNNIIKACLVFISLMTGFILLAKNYLVKLKNNYFKTNISKNNFILLILIWQAVYLLLFYPLALNVDSRYFLVVLFIPFILLGFAFNFIENYFKKKGKIITFFLAIFLIILNFFSTFSWVKSIDNYNKKGVEVNEFILEPYYLVTNKQWKKITNIIENEFDKNKHPNVYVHSSPYHIRSLLYLLQIENGLPVAEIDVENLDSKGMFFLLRESDKFKNKDKLTSDLENNFEIVKEVDFGTVVLVQLELKNKENFHEKDRLIDVGYEVSDNRCFMLELGIEEKAKCTVGDLKFIFGK